IADAVADGLIARAGAADGEAKPAVPASGDIGAEEPLAEWELAVLEGKATSEDAAPPAPEGTEGANGTNGTNGAADAAPAAEATQVSGEPEAAGVAAGPSDASTGEPEGA
ncbi:MAG TPA: hypothetical protein VFE00_09835, partial [Arthrobacter sp.]|nr:hypothetical protein [Arthrobacter sp.]